MKVVSCYYVSPRTAWLAFRICTFPVGRQKWSIQYVWKVFEPSHPSQAYHQSSPFKILFDFCSWLGFSLWPPSGWSRNREARSVQSVPRETIQALFSKFPFIAVQVLRLIQSQSSELWRKFHEVTYWGKSSTNILNSSIMFMFFRLLRAIKGPGRTMSWLKAIFVVLASPGRGIEAIIWTNYKET